MKLILAGTPEISYEVFKNIILKNEVVAIICQPDKETGRGKKITPQPVKKLAQEFNILLLQPNKIIDIYDFLKNTDFDIFLTLAYGQYIPEKILTLEGKKFLNIHCSLLPKYRGAAPIQRAIMNNEKITGISLIYMVNKMDAGNIIFKKEMPIDNSETSGTLFLKMTEEINILINDWLINFYNNNFQEEIQNEDLVSLAPKLSKEEAFLEKDDSIKMINKVRAFNPNPGCYIFQNNKRIKIFNLGYEDKKDALKIESLDKPLFAYEFQFEGKKKRTI
ncbi:MAG: methionyl-tRNA formyltransferase [Metamycoplasmataceae bacterium]